ncbi:MAG: response regulator [Magnetococcales bacterium]|nr:response regulator [Magnetococcales bacterium]
MDTRSGISSVVKSHLVSVAPSDTTLPEKQPVVVSVSRNFGSNGGKIAELLAARLQVNCYGHSMIDELIKTTKTTKRLMSLMDEKLPKPIDSFLYSLFLAPEQSVAGYYKNMIKTILMIAQKGGVILGRGARLVLANHPHVFRVGIEGSYDVCVRRVAQRESISLEEAKRKIAETEKERSRFLKGLYKRFPSNRTYYDLVINSDKIDPQHAVEIIVNAMESMGYPVPGKELKAEEIPQPHAVVRHAATPAQKTDAIRIGMNFLIVEDEVEFFAIINGWLTNSIAGKESSSQMPSLHLTHAKTFKEAELFLSQHKYDLILLDLNLADSHGYEETFVRMNQKNLDTPIIVFTGLDDEQKAIQAVADGAQDYLVKGQVNKKTLVRSIKQAMSRYKIMRQYTRI